jgi:hypothetical protein
MFALDVFEEGYDFWQTILALLIHLIPAFLIVVALVIAWRWERIGAAIFIILSVFYLIMSKGQSWIISGPLLLAGILFLIHKTVSR